MVACSAILKFQKESFKTMNIALSAAGAGYEGSSICGSRRLPFMVTVFAISVSANAATISVSPGDDIALAVAAAADGDVIELTAGSYSPTATVVLNKDLTVKGAGPQATVINGSGVSGRVFSISSSGAVLEDLSVTAANSGAVWMSNGTVTNCAFSQCKAATGGAIEMTGGLVTDSSFTGNYLTDQYTGHGGAAVYLTGGTVRNCDITRNNASAGDYYGNGKSGAVCLDDDNAVVENCRIIGNTLANISGYNFVKWGRVAGVYIAKGLLRNCIVANNVNSYTEFGGGIYMTGGKAYNNTIVGNSALKDATHRSGIMLVSGSPIAKNNIIAYNGLTGTEGGCNVAAGIFTHNLVDNAVNFAGASDNLIFDPKFVDYASLDLRLQFSSPAIDAGTELDDVTSDIRGVARPQGGGYDLGAYEHVPGSAGLNIAILADTDTITEGESISFRTRYEGAEPGASVEIRWYCDDTQMSGAPVATGATYSWANVEAGNHTVTAAIFLGGAAEPACSDSFPFSALAVNVYVAKNGGEIYPYNNPEKAARSIDAALGAVAKIEGVTSTVHIAAGSYTVSSTFEFVTPLAISGAGSDSVTVSANGSKGVSFIKSTSLLNVQGITFSGFNCTSQGAVFTMSGGLIKECLFSGNTAGGEGGAIYMVGGTVTNCVFENNCGYGGGGIALSGGLVTSCRFEKNRLVNAYQSMYAGAAVLVKGGTVRNCEIVGNLANAGGYGVESGGAVSLWGEGAIVENCFIARNILAPGQSMSQWGRVAGVNIKAGTVRNCIIYANTNSHNSAKNYAGGVYMTGGKFYHNTVVGNYVIGDSSNRSGIFLHTGAPDARNNIFAFNGLTGTEGGCHVAAGTFVDNITDNDVTYSGASGNRNADPAFRDKDNLDFSLAAGSPAIDKGEEVGGITSDYNGRTRPLGEGYDAGAFEYMPGEFGFVHSILCDATAFKAGTSVDFTMSVDGLPSSANVVCRWYCDNEAMTGQADGTGMTFTWATPEVGPHKITAACYVDGASEPSGINTYEFDILPFEVFVSVNGGNVKPYSTPETAANRFDDAWASVWKEASVTTIIHVAAGAYTNSASMDISTPVKIIGDNADSVRFVGTALSIAAPMFKLGHPEAELRGVTVMACTNDANGKAVMMTAGSVRDCRFEGNCGKGDGGAIWMSSGTVSNCKFISNRAVTGGAIAMSGGLVTDSHFSGNFLADEYTGHGGAAIYLTGGTVRNCEITRNNASAGDFYGHGKSGAVCLDGSTAIVENSMIVSNTLADVKNYSYVKWANVAGVYIADGQLRNCLVAGNVNSYTEQGGGIYMTGGMAYNNTVVGNTAKNDTAHRSGIIMKLGSPIAKNNIFAFNGPTGTEGGCNIETGVFENNATDNEVANEGNTLLTRSPFANFEKGKYWLRSDASECIDKGDSSVWDDVDNPVDLAGNRRISGKSIDLGCYEHRNLGLIITVK